MTAEIAIMNKSAVALAADSAVTISAERRPKIFNTVNKVFCLSKYHPVGVMVYGSAQIMRVPWETIIKLYRARIRDRDFPHLEDYSSDFLRFLARNRSLFSAREQDEYFYRLVSAFYRYLNSEIQTEVQKKIEKTGKISVSDIQQICRSQINSQFEGLKAADTLRGFNQRFEKGLLKKYSSRLSRLQRELFQKLPLRRADKTKIRTMSAWLFTKDNFRLEGTSGVVIAGFGQRDIYPRLAEFTVEGVIQNKLRFCPRRKAQVGRDCISTILPFGQIEVVQAFIDGIDPDMGRLFFRFINEVFENYPAALLNHVKGLTAKAKAEAIKKTRAVSGEILKKFLDKFEEFRRKTLVDPIVSTVAVLPKDELAAMAEALVNLTSFRRRFSPDAETVGGPIDVAILSRGDGFIWVKRKHYFKLELNPQFSTNYFRDI